VGTAYAASSHIWFTFWNGILTEAYYPTVDRPQIRDLQYLVTDGKSFFHEERRHLQSKVELLSAHALGIAVPTPIQLGVMPSSKQSSPIHTMHAFFRHTQIIGDDSFVSSPRLYALCASHLSRFVWIRRPERWLDGFGRQFPDGLGV
jgi:glucoamylase